METISRSDMLIADFLQSFRIHRGDVTLFDPAHHRFYPMHKQEIIDFLHEDSYPSCSCCGNQLDWFMGGTEHGRCWVWIVVTSAETMRLLCQECRKAEPIGMKWEDQQWGHREPIKFPEKFSSSIVHKVVWREFFGFDRKYRAMNFPKGIKALSDIGGELGLGGYYGHDCGYIAKDGKLLIFAIGTPDVEFKLTESQIVAICNEIITEQQDKPIFAGMQLSLF